MKRYKIKQFEAKALADKHCVHLEAHKNTVGHVMNEFFEELFTDNLYFEISSHAIEMADKLKDLFN